MLRNLIGNRAFYKRVMALALPVMIQNGITNFVNMLDNVMVGRTGTLEMTGVTIANQLIFVFNLCIFGAVSGAGIFGAQFAGNGDQKGLTYTLRFKLLSCSLLAAVCIGVFLLWGEPLIGLYLQGEGSAADAAASLGFAKQYLTIMLIGLIPYTIAQCYASTLRETGQTSPPMVAGVVAVLVNLALNAVLIFGYLGAPRLGVVGAAIATVTSRFVELAIVAIWTHTHREKNGFAADLYRSLYIPRRLIGQITLKGLPLMLNETLWSMGMATLSQQYSLRGQAVVAANNICQTFFNVFSVAFMAIGVVVGIMVGQQLGAGDTEGAKDTARKLIVFSVIVGLVVGAAYAVCAGFIPQLYNTTDNIRHIATELMLVCAAAMPVEAFAHATYFTIRSGGKAFITFVFDSGFMWGICVPVAFLLVRYTALPVLWVYAAVQGINFIKCFIGGYLVKQGGWVKTIVE
ncbi:MAG: MATE family efflux transporter [Clostridia bacterium]|nr:MATE family efflux transporter [Clostridia bacterium]